MEPKKNISDYDLDTLDLEIFSTNTSRNIPKKHFQWHEFINKSYIKTGLTLGLLLFLFGSTFLIASKINKPIFTISSADIGYIPQAHIDIPQLTGIRSCSEVSYEEGDTTFLHSFCQGNICESQPDKETCEEVDVIVFKNGILSEESGQDGIADCIWIEEESVCKPKY